MMSPYGIQEPKEAWLALVDHIGNATVTLKFWQTEPGQLTSIEQQKLFLIGSVTILLDGLGSSYPADSTKLSELKKHIVAMDPHSKESVDALETFHRGLNPLLPNR